MDIRHSVQLSVTVKPVGTPLVKISAGSKVWQVVLHQTQTFEFEFESKKTFDLQIEHQAKPDLDPITAVEILDISLFGISDNRFRWSGVYYPQYPPHLLDQPKILPSQTYLSWNGVYKLVITVPVFEWMHQTLDLGWIYR